MNPRQLLREVTAQLTAAGVDSPGTDALQLLCQAYRLPRLELYRADDLPADVVAPLVRRRAAREPLQHIVGNAPFRHVRVQVGRGVFVPRPETELLVDAVLPVLCDTSAPVAVDLCAGSGALALALANEIEGIELYAVERAPQALQWLQRNCSGTAVVPVAGDVAEATLLVALRGRVDAVVTNPPYVPAGTALPPEAAADPPEALFAGPDGMGLMPAVLARAADLLRAGGVLALEHDESHAESVLELLAASGDWARIGAHNDLTGRARYVTAERGCGAASAR